MTRPAAAPGGPRACLRLCHRLGSRALAAGATFTNRTTSAPWHARAGHTTVIDAAGAIYVIGGQGDLDGSGTFGTYFYQDVWASTDGGARPDSVVGSRGVLGGYSGILWGIKGVLKGCYTSTTGGTMRVLWGTMGYYRATMGYSRGTMRYLGGT